MAAIHRRRCPAAEKDAIIITEKRETDHRGGQALVKCGRYNSSSPLSHRNKAHSTPISCPPKVQARAGSGGAPPPPLMARILCLAQYTITACRSSSTYWAPHRSTSSSAAAAAAAALGVRRKRSAWAGSSYRHFYIYKFCFFFWRELYV